MYCNTTVKVLLALAGAFAIAGTVVVILALTAGDAAGLDFEAEGTNSASLVAPTEKEHCGWVVYLEQGQDCERADAGLTVTAPAGSGDWNPKTSLCWNPGKTQQEHDDKVLLESFHISTKSDGFTYAPGTYRLTSTAAKVWLVDWCGELEEAVGGFFAALGLMIVAIVLFVVSFILCCVSCCCCSSKPAPVAPVQEVIIQGK